MAGAGCVTKEDFGVRGINVADWGVGHHILINGAGVYDGGVRDSVDGFGWKRGVNASRISRRDIFYFFIVTSTCYTCGPA